MRHFRLFAEHDIFRKSVVFSIVRACQKNAEAAPLQISSHSCSKIELTPHTDLVLFHDQHTDCHSKITGVCKSHLTVRKNKTETAKRSTAKCNNERDCQME